MCCSEKAQHSHTIFFFLRIKLHKIEVLKNVLILN